VGNTLVDVIGSLSEGIPLAFALGLLVLAPIDGLSGCATDYTPRQRGWRVGGIYAAMATLLTLGVNPAFSVGFMLGALLAMSALQGLYRETPQPAQMVARRHTM